MSIQTVKASRENSRDFKNCNFVSPCATTKFSHTKMKPSTSMSNFSKLRRRKVKREESESSHKEAGSREKIKQVKKVRETVMKKKMDGKRNELLFIFNEITLNSFIEFERIKKP